MCVLRYSHPLEEDAADTAADSQQQQQPQQQQFGQLVRPPSEPDMLAWSSAGGRVGASLKDTVGMSVALLSADEMVRALIAHCTSTQPLGTPVAVLFDDRFVSSVVFILF